MIKIIYLQQDYLPLSCFSVLNPEIITTANRFDTPYWKLENLFDRCSRVLISIFIIQSRLKREYSFFHRYSSILGGDMATGLLTCALSMRSTHAEQSRQNPNPHSYPASNSKAFKNQITAFAIVKKLPECLIDIVLEGLGKFQSRQTYRIVIRHQQTHFITPPGSSAEPKCPPAG